MKRKKMYDGLLMSAERRGLMRFNSIEYIVSILVQLDVIGAQLR
jgi:hypothetical protein